MSDDYNLGSGPVQDEYAAKMKDLARAIDYLFNGDGPKETGFILMVFPYEAGKGRCNYMSNANRDDVKVLLKEQLSYFEGMSDKQSGTS